MTGMTEFGGKVAVVTGGASGIGRGIAERLVAEGMQVVIADIEAGRLEQTAQEIGAFAIRTDVSDLASVEALAARTQERFGAVHILCNNAGVGPFGRIRDLTMADWQWMIGVNLWGVIHGVQAFLPILLDNPDGGWVVNTASMGGLSTFPGLGAYATSKFGVVALTETLALELKDTDARVGATLLCPGPVHSNLGQSFRNRQQPETATGLADLDLSALPQYRDALPWKDPAYVADVLMDSLREGRLYAITHPEQVERVEKRAEAMLAAFGKKIEISPL